MTAAAPTSRPDLVERVERLAAGRPRTLIGIAGLPGAGKTTVAVALVEDLRARGVAAAHVPMDGFHLADVALDALGRRGRKGAIDTFDADGYAALLARIRSGRGTTIWAPAFERDIEQPIAGSIAIPPETTVIVSEGNYLLAEQEPWPVIRELFDDVWFVEVDDPLRRERLVARHVRFGKTPAEAADWVERVDEVNARLIASSAGRADLALTSE